MGAACRTAGFGIAECAFLKKYLGYSVRAQIQDFLSPLAISAVMVAMVSVTGTLVENMLLKLVLQVFVGSIIHNSIHRYKK